MNKTLISIEELKQLALREIHTYPGCEDVSAVGMYPVTDEVTESKLVCPSRKQPRHGKLWQAVTNMPQTSLKRLVGRQAVTKTGTSRDAVRALNKDRASHRGW